jgi:hypothetical protein
MCRHARAQTKHSQLTANLYQAESAGIPECKQTNSHSKEGHHSRVHAPAEGAQVLLHTARMVDVKLSRVVAPCEACDAHALLQAAAAAAAASSVCY